MDGAKPKIVKRVPLLGVIDEQDESCFAHVRPVNYVEKRENAETDFKSMSDAQGVDYQNNFVRSHFVRGKIRVYNDDTQQMELQDLAIEDVLNSIELTDVLYFAALGVELDPKVIREAETPVADSQPVEKTSSETSSSTTSPATNSEAITPLT